MNKEEIKHKVLQIIISLDILDSEVGDSEVKSEGWDSLRQMHIVLEVEKQFNIRFDESEIPDLRSIDMIVERLLALHAN
jgi:acyl carrier protein